jgi:hypothetical protein
MFFAIALGYVEGLAKVVDFVGVAFANPFDV